MNLIQVMLAEGRNTDKSKGESRTKVVAEIAAFVAVSTALSYVKVFNLPQGGSVTAGSMVPVVWLSLRRGAKIGLSACVLYGIVQLAVNPFVFHPIQVLLDYPVAFGALGLAGFFQKAPSWTREIPKTADRIIAILLCTSSFLVFGFTLTRFKLAETLFFALIFMFSFIFLLWAENRTSVKRMEEQGKVAPALAGAAVAIFGRFLAHFVSGVVFFGSFAPEGVSPIVYSILYNGSYIVPELLVSGYLMYLLAKSGMTKIYR